MYQLPGVAHDKSESVTRQADKGEESRLFQSKSHWPSQAKGEREVLGSIPS